MLDYQQEHGRLPPAVVYGHGGKPLLSWRVLLLPYMEQTALEKEFRLDEPWDSPHNLRLLPRMPKAYAPPGSKAAKVPAHHTVCHVFVGKGTAFEGPEGLRVPEDFPDGPSSTLLIVEGGGPVPWTKPEELPYEPDEPLPELATLFTNGFRVGLADHSTRWVRKETSEATIRAAITRNGGEPMGPDWPGR